MSNPTPTTQAEASILQYASQHIADQTNAHVNGIPTTGQVPTKQSDGTTAWATPPGAAGGAPAGSAVPKSWSGTGSAGASSNASREDHVHPSGLWSPSDMGLKGWTNDPALATAAVALNSGTIYVARLKLDTTGVIANIIIDISTQAAAGASNCYIGVYDVTTLGQLGISADQSSGWISTGHKVIPLTSATSSQLAGGMVYVALVYTGSALALRGFATAPNIGSYGMVRSATAGTGQTTLPSTLGTLTTNTSMLLISAS